MTNSFSKTLLISGESGTGKSTSLMNIKNPEGVLYLNCDSGKALPFNSRFKEVTVNDPYDLFEYFDQINKDETKRFHTIIIDTVSFLMDKLGKWKLSPAYDVTYAYNPNNRWLRQHQMSVNGKRNKIGRLDLMAVTEVLDPRSKRVIIDQVVEGISEWKGIGKEAGVPAQRVNEIENNLKYHQIQKEKNNKKPL